MKHDNKNNEWIYNHKCPMNLKVLSKENNAKLINKLLNKAKLYLKNKYNSMIIDKQYNLNDFTPQMMKEITDYNYYNYPNESELLRIIESKFLKELNKHDDKKRRILFPGKLREMTEQPNYQFNVLLNENLNKKKMVHLIEKNKNQVEKRRIREIKKLEQRKCEEEISQKVEQKLFEAEKDYLKKVLTVNKEGNDLIQILENKKQDCLIEALYK